MKNIKIVSNTTLNITCAAIDLFAHDYLGVTLLINDTSSGRYSNGTTIDIKDININATDGIYEDTKNEVEKLTKTSITGTNLYRIKDPEVLRVLLLKRNHTKTDAFNYTEILNITSLSDLFYRNVNIKNFDEFENFNGITSLSPVIFYGCTSLESIKLPNSITSITDSVSKGSNGTYYGTYYNDSDWHNNIYYSLFMNCYNLKSIDLNNIVIIGSNMFYNCINLSNVILNDTTTLIMDYAFYNCYSLTNLNIPSSVSLLGTAAFSGCASLQSISLLGNIVSLGTHICYGCTYLTSVDIPNYYGAIPAHMFAQCRELLTVDMSNSTNIGADSFYLCTKLTTLTSSPPTTIGNEAFLYCYNLTIIPDLSLVTTLGTYSFAYCLKLESISIPNVLTIPDYCFLYDTSLKEINISSVTSIGVSAFRDCKSLEKIITSESTNVTTLPNNTFYNCRKLTNFGNLLDTCTDTVLRTSTFCGCGILEGGTFKIPDRYTSFTNSDCLFYHAKMERIFWSANFTTDNGYRMFNSCPNLREVIYPEGVISLTGGSNFWGCYNLENVYYPSTLQTVSLYYLYPLNLDNYSDDEKPDVTPTVSKLKMYVYATTPPTMTSWAASSYWTKIYVPTGCSDAYKAANGWSSYAAKIEEFDPIANPLPTE